MSDSENDGTHTNDANSDEKKQTGNGSTGMSKQQLKYEISKLEPDSRGWFTVRFPKPDDGYTPEEAKEEFGQYGEVKETHFTAKFIYIRFVSKTAARDCVTKHGGQRDVEVPSVSKTWKKDSHGSDQGPQLYVGNISPRASKAEVKALFIPYKMNDFKFYKIDNKTFAFVYVQTAADAKRAIKEVNGKKLKDTTLTVTLSQEQNRAKILSGEDEVRRGEIELYMANFKWGTTLYELRQLLQPYGFKSVRLESRSDGECNKAYAVMWSFESAIAAINALNQSTWYGQRIFVTLWNRDDGRPMRSDELEQLQMAEMNNRMMNYGIDRAVVLTQRLDAMIDDVIDECYYCSRVRNMMTELTEVVQQLQYSHYSASGGSDVRGSVPPMGGAGMGGGAGLHSHQTHKQQQQQQQQPQSNIPSLLGAPPGSFYPYEGGRMGGYEEGMAFGFKHGQRKDMFGNGTQHGGHGGRSGKGRGRGSKGHHN